MDDNVRSIYMCVKNNNLRKCCVCVRACVCMCMCACMCEDLFGVDILYF